MAFKLLQLIAPLVVRHISRSVMIAVLFAISLSTGPVPSSQVPPQATIAASPHLARLNPAAEQQVGTTASTDNGSTNWATASSVIQALCAVVIAALTLYLALSTGGMEAATRDAANAAIQSANAASASAKASETAASVMAASDRHFRTVERAYIGLSPHLPGIEVRTQETGEAASGQPRRWLHKLSLRIKVQNHGNTPAEVTATHLELRLSNAPYSEAPSYLPELTHRGRVSLVKGEHFTLTVPYEFASVGESDFVNAFTEMAKADHRLYVVGYADYLDKFGQRHRAGFARLYLPEIDHRTRREYFKHQAAHASLTGFARQLAESSPRFDHDLYDKRNNLVFLTVPGYNYDREREPGEGDD